MENKIFKTNRWLKEFVFEQKCIPWRFWPFISKYINKVKMSTGRYYDKSFYNSVEKLQRNSCSIIIRYLVEKYHPVSVVDVGCGNGMYLDEFRKYGINVFGYDNSREGLKRCNSKKIPVSKFNIVKDAPSHKKGCDLALCFEVAEHIPAFASKKLVSTLCSLSKIIVFTAAPPGQGGENHINEQPYIFWIEKFNYLNFCLDNNDTEYLKDTWRKTGNVVNYMVNNLMIFKSKN